MMESKRDQLSRSARRAYTLARLDRVQRVAILIDRWSIQSYVGLDFSWKPLTWRDFLPALRFRRAIPRP
jgi:hypothetical protein